MSVSLRENITAVIESCFSETKEEIQEVAINNILELIRNNTDRPQGEWINKHEWANGFYERECSICGAMKPILMHTAKVNYCPNCGCRMKGADDGSR